MPSMRRLNRTARSGRWLSAAAGHSMSFPTPHRSTARPIELTTGGKELFCTVHDIHVLTLYIRPIAPREGDRTPPPVDCADVRAKEKLAASHQEPQVKFVVLVADLVAFPSADCFDR